MPDRTTGGDGDVHEINSPEYWDRRFRVDWSACGGNAQSTAFMELLDRMLPDSVRQTIHGEQLEVVDWGCAEGDGVPVLEQAFPNSAVVGIDVAPTAIGRARERYPESRFECLDVTTTDRRTDVVVCSNVLEHFADPQRILERLADMASTYVIVLVPFLEEPLIDEHEVSFTHDSFPLRLDGGKRLIHARSVDLRWRRRSPWPGFQLLVIYSDRDEGATLGDLDHGGARLSRRRDRQQAIERVLRPLYRAARVDRWLLGRSANNR